MKFHAALPVLAGVLVLAACSGNLTGGATPPVTPQSGTNLPGGGVVPQGSQAKPAGDVSNATPIPSATAQITLHPSPTPFPLPSGGGYGGTVTLAAALPLPSESPAVDMTLNIFPSAAPTSPSTAKTKAKTALAGIDFQPSGGDALFEGLSGLKFTMPAAQAASAKHLAIGFFETDLPPGPRALFHHHRDASTALLAFDEHPKLDATGALVSAQKTALTLHADHHYRAVVYADHLATPTPAPTPAPGATATATAGASPSSSASAPVTPFPQVSGFGVSPSPAPSASAH